LKDVLLSDILGNRVTPNFDVNKPNFFQSQ
jgi:hypothetical protein